MPTTMKIGPCFFLLLLFTPGLTFGEGTGKNFLRIEKSTQSDTDLSITSIGGFGFNDGKIGHADLLYIKSVNEGDGLAMDAGAAYAFNAGAAFFVGGGFLLGYNWDKNGIIGAFYPEAGIAVNITKSLGITLGAKRYFNLYDDTENIIMFGLLFSDL
ncbi:MAG TPA: hypothetical protein ENK04_01470 [Gammaproteobacteria bacterium]|nr:hypothetical protein [Gammaproteobacteria bacterium]